MRGGQDEEEEEGVINLSEAFERVDKNDSRAISATIAEQNDRGGAAQVKRSSVANPSVMQRANAT
jgi:hypothetical protein